MRWWLVTLLLAVMIALAVFGVALAASFPALPGD
jgi:hypothetical protein